MTADAPTNSTTLSRLNLVADWLLDLVFPPTCAHCGRVDAHFCAHCRAELARYPLQDARQAVVGLDRMYTTGKHQGALASAVRAFKYEGATDLSHLLAERLITAVRTQIWRVDVVVPVPLHADRLLERGYNQAALLGDQVARSLGFRFEPGLLRRIRSTSQQARLSGSERLENVSGAFDASPATQDKAILLIDDVVTTGSTLSECARALRARNAAALYGIAISHA